MVAVSVGLDVGLEIMWPCLGLENFICPWPSPWEKVLALALALKNFHVLGLGLGLVN